MDQTISRSQALPQTQGVGAWVWQRISAALLLLLLGVHLAILHFVPANLNINVLVVATRLNTVLYFVVDGGLLAIGLYHGLNGLRSVLFDFVTAEGKRRWLNLVLWTVGLAFFVWGATALFVFLQ